MAPLLAHLRLPALKCIPRPRKGPGGSARGLHERNSCFKGGPCPALLYFEPASNQSPLPCVLSPTPLGEVTTPRGRTPRKAMFSGHGWLPPACCGLDSAACPTGVGDSQQWHSHIPVLLAVPWGSHQAAGGAGKGSGPPAWPPTPGSRRGVHRYLCVPKGGRKIPHPALPEHQEEALLFL